MSLAVGIVGLPNVGKSTLFNALTKKQQAAAENYPFCTIEPNTAVVEVEDKRLEALAKIVNPAQIIKATVDFTDIAGLVKGASKGAGSARWARRARPPAPSSRAATRSSSMCRRAIPRRSDPRSWWGTG